MLILEMESTSESLSSSRTWYYTLSCFFAILFLDQSSQFCQAPWKVRGIALMKHVSLWLFPGCGSGLGWHFSFLPLFTSLHLPFPSSTFHQSWSPPHSCSVWIWPSMFMDQDKFVTTKLLDFVSPLLTSYKPSLFSWPFSSDQALISNVS